MDKTTKRIKASTIMILCTIITFALVVMGIIGALECIKQFKNVTAAVSNVTLFRSSMRKLIAVTYEQRNRVQLYAVTLDRRYYDQWKTAKGQSERDVVIKEMRVLGLTPSEERIMDEITVLKARITKKQEEALSVEDRTNSDIITANGRILDQISYDIVTREIGQMLIRSDYTEDGEKLLELIETLQNTIIGRAMEDITKEQSDMNRFLLMEMAILGALLIMILAVYIIIRKRIIVPMQQVEKHFGQISDGDLHTRISLNEDTSEVGQLVKAANIMQSKFSGYIKELEFVLSELSKGNLNQHVSDNFTGDFVTIRDSLRLIISSYKESFAEINNAAYEVSNGSEQIAMSSQSLSEGATEQASTIEELTANVNEVTSRVNETAENAEKVKTSAVEMTEVINTGNESMIKLTQTMKDLNRFSSDIYKIVKTIDNIAFQTNILALNASVEAARAEQYGASFGVVADEVRALAAQSAKSAQSTALLIEQTIAAIKEGADTANMAEGVLHSMVVKAENVKRSVVKITDAMESDAAAVQQALASIEQLSSIVQANSASAEETAAASEEIAAQATAMMELVKKFA